MVPWFNAVKWVICTQSTTVRTLLGYPRVKEKRVAECRMQASTPSSVEGGKTIPLLWTCAGGGADSLSIGCRLVLQFTNVLMYSDVHWVHGRISGCLGVPDTQLIPRVHATIS